MSVGVYPGTFDPITMGHLDIIRRSCKLFDRVIVAVAQGFSKERLFTLEERMEMVRAAVEDLPRVEVKALDGLLTEFVRREGACAIIRGLRAISDFEQEFQMSVINKKLTCEIETVFLMAAAEYSFLSSRVVRQVATVGGCIKGLVPPVVELALQAKFNRLEHLRAAIKP